MADANDLNHQAVVQDLIDDSVVTHPDPVGAAFACHGDTARRPRIVCQQVYGGPDALPFSARQGTESLHRSP